MHGLAQDLRYALRAMRRAPLFTAVAVACLAIGIGVNAAAFGVMDALLLRDFPGVDRQRELSVILLSRQESWGRTSHAQLSVPEGELFRQGVPGFVSSVCPV